MWPAAAADALDDVVHLLAHAGHGPEQCRRIEIALDAAVVADAIPGFVDRNPPVRANHVAAGFAHDVQHHRRAGAEVDRGRPAADDLEDPARVGERELPVVGGTERTDPRVEHLDDIDTGFDLRHQILAHQLRQRAAETMPGVGVPEHQRLGLGERVGVPAFDRVGRKCERRPGEANQRQLAVQLVLDLANGLQHEAQLLARLEAPQGVDVCGRGQRPLETRSLAADEVEGQPQRRQWNQQIREQDGGVHLDAAQRLQRHLGGQVRLAADFQQPVPLSQRPVFGHVPSGLAHEPDGRGVHRLRAGRLAGTGRSRRAHERPRQRHQLVEPERLVAHHRAERGQLAEGVWRGVQVAADDRDRGPGQMGNLPQRPGEPSARGIEVLMSTTIALGVWACASRTPSSAVSAAHTS